MLFSGPSSLSFFSFASVDFSLPRFPYETVFSTDFSNHPIVKTHSNWRKKKKKKTLEVSGRSEQEEREKAVKLPKELRSI